MATTAIGLTEKQLAMRAAGVGASEVPAVVGLVPGAIAVWERKVGLAPEQEQTSFMEFGHRIEEVIGDAYQARHPETRIYTPGTLRHAKHEWALATPDRVVAPPGLGRPAREVWQQLLEIKTVFFASREYGEEEIPEKHLVQVQWQLEVADMTEATLVALVNGDYREYPVVRDREVGGLLLELVGKWWRDHVVAGAPPPPDGSPAYESYLRRRHPSELAPLLPATPEAEALVRRLKELKEAVKGAEAAEAIAKQELEQLLGDAAGIEGLCTWKANRPSLKTDWEAVARNVAAATGIQPAQFAATVESQTITKAGARVLRLQTPKKGA
jgi:putative phage-type endonuclease